MFLWQRITDIIEQQHVFDLIELQKEYIQITEVRNEHMTC